MTTVEHPTIDTVERIDTDDDKHDRFSTSWRPGRALKKSMCPMCRDIGLARGWNAPTR